MAHRLSLNTGHLVPDREAGLVLAPSELSSVAALSPYRQLAVAAHPDQLDSERRQQLAQLGFEPVAVGYSQTLDLTPFSSAAQLIKGVGGQFASRIRRAQRLTKSGEVQTDVVALGAGSEAILAEFFEEVFVPACCYRGINPFSALAGPKRLQMLLAQTGKDKEVPRLLTVRRGGKLEGAAILSVQRGAPLQLYQVPVEPIWKGREIPSHERFSHVVIIHARPLSGIESEISTLLWLGAITWSIENGVPWFSAGFVEASTFWAPSVAFRGGYLGVVSYKKQFSTKVMVMRSPVHSVFMRMSRAAVFAARDNAMFCRLPERDGDAPTLVYVIGSGLDDHNLQRILVADPEWQKEIEVPTPHHARRASELCQRAGLDAKVTVWPGTAG
jgi:hypothetical protein